MSHADYDLKYLQAGLDELKNYLLSKELFWPLGLPTPSGQSPYPKMTLGNLLLFNAELQAHHTSGSLNAAQSSALQKVEALLESTQQKWQVAWQEKTTWEFRSRLRQWSHYLNDLNREAENHRPYYATEVRLRAMLDLLAATLASAPPVSASLPMLDSQLKTLLPPGDFVWNQQLAAGFPSEQYWYLYREIEEA